MRTNGNCHYTDVVVVVLLQPLLQGGRAVWLKAVATFNSTEATEVCTVPGDTLRNSKSSTIITHRANQEFGGNDYSTGRPQQDGALCTLLVPQLKRLYHLPDGSGTDVSWWGFSQFIVTDTFKHLAAEFPCPHTLKMQTPGLLRRSEILKSTIKEEKGCKRKGALMCVWMEPASAAIVATRSLGRASEGCR